MFDLFINNILFFTSVIIYCPLPETMKAELFEEVVTQYWQLRKLHGINQMKIIVDQLVEMYKERNLEYPTLFSLVNYEYRKEAKCWQNQCSKSNSEKIEAEWNTQSSSSILQLAEKYNVCAYTLIRQITTKICGSKDIAKQWLKDPSLVNVNEKLAYEIMLLNVHDIMNGLFYNQISLNAGIAYELEVRKFLEQNKISFMTEDDLRNRSYDVTPDFSLKIPMIVVRTTTSVQLYRSDDDSIPAKKLPGEVERLVITWIECKALFASADCHIEYYENQFYSYINRFGNGLILYKYGFVENLPAKYTRNLVLSQKMPLLAPSWPLNDWWSDSGKLSQSCFY